jgi:hypothetical protein
MGCGASAPAPGYVLLPLHELEPKNARAGPKPKPKQDEMDELMSVDEAKKRRQAGHLEAVHFIFSLISFSR